ncbi:hypothetical protein E1200_21280 [Actinomadura sp. GC306]|uniref:hypothetical protein n=1 Tax=Actinomadura sp. GC306 TaxID=2530367 RepID=UPI0010502371|nr:hypothetical protein [Actinomadura sp. GC306]TDC63921.1 hypothetical protein E1200_21280 [Actinomadura sp. GC306]
MAMWVTPKQASALEEDVCGKLDWTFLGSASSHSQFAGLLAGFVLAIMGILLAQRGNDGKRILALTLFSAAFFVLAVDSVLFGIIAGERTCIRAHTEGLIASGLLAMGGALALAGLAWLFDISIDGEGRKELVRIAVVTAYGTQLVGILLVTQTVYGFQHDLSTAKYWKYTSLPEWTVWVWTATVLILLLIRIARRPRILGPQARALRLASYYAVGCTMASVILFGMVVGMDRTIWEPQITTNLTWVTAILTLVLPTVGLLILGRAIPRSSD